MTFTEILKIMDVGDKIFFGESTQVAYCELNNGKKSIVFAKDLSFWKEDLLTNNDWKIHRTIIINNLQNINIKTEVV